MKISRSLIFAAGLFGLTTQQASAVLLTYELTDPDSLFSATFVYSEDDSNLDGYIYSSDLVSITADILGTGLFTYDFSSSSTNNCGAYDVSDLSLISWTCGGQVQSTNSNSLGQTLSYAHTWYDESRFTLDGMSVSADWNGHGIELSGNTDLNTPNGAVPEPSALALLGAGVVGLGFARRRRKVQD